MSNKESLECVKCCKSKPKTSFRFTLKDGDRSNREYLEICKSCEAYDARKIRREKLNEERKKRKRKRSHHNYHKVKKKLRERERNKDFYW